jgi:hypothetical protein
MKFFTLCMDEKKASQFLYNVQPWAFIDEVSYNLFLIGWKFLLFTWMKRRHLIDRLKFDPPGPLPPSPSPRSPKTLKRAKAKEETRGKKSRYSSAVRCSRQILLPERALQRATTQLEVSRPSPHRSETPSRKIWDLKDNNILFLFLLIFSPPVLVLCCCGRSSGRSHEG